MNYPNYETVIVSRKGPVGILTINRPDRTNAINKQLALDICDALRKLQEDDEVRAIVLKAAGKNFGAGLDLTEMSKSSEQVEEFMKAVAATRTVFYEVFKPIIGAVQGTAITASANFVRNCDMLVAAEDAQFGTIFINYGSSCIPNIMQLGSQVGFKKAFEWDFTGDFASAQDYEKYGLVNKVVPQEKLDEAAMELAEKCASKSPLATQLAKRGFLIARQQEMGQEESGQFLGKVQRVLLFGKDYKEGIAAFKEKRAPVWEKSVSREDLEEGIAAALEGRPPVFKGSKKEESSGGGMCA